jgi:hypothetical protein
MGQFGQTDAFAMEKSEQRKNGTLFNGRGARFNWPPHLLFSRFFALHRPLFMVCAIFFCASGCCCDSGVAKKHNARVNKG